MKYAFASASVLLSLALWASQARAIEPYIQIGLGAFTRDIVEEDPSISGLKFKGTADSTRLIAKAGLDIGGVLNLYAQGGGADLSIDEFDQYAASMKGAYGGGLRINLYNAPYHDGTKLFVEGSYLHFQTDDRVQIEQCASPPVCSGSTSLYLPRPADETIRWNEYTISTPRPTAGFAYRKWMGKTGYGRPRTRISQTGSRPRPTLRKTAISEFSSGWTFFWIDPRKPS